MQNNSDNSLTRSTIKEHHPNGMEALKTMLPILLISIVMGVLCYLVSIHVANLKIIDYERWLLYGHYRFRAVLMNYREPLNPSISIIGIDEKTLQKDRLPLIYWNKRLEPVVRMLVKNGAKVVGIDAIQYLTMKDALAVVVDRECRERLTDDLYALLKDRGIERSLISGWMDKMADKMPIASKDREMALQMLSKKVVLVATINAEGKLNKSIDVITLAAGWDNIGVADMGVFDDKTAIYQYPFFREAGVDEEIPSFAVRIVEKFTGSEFTGKDGRRVVKRDGTPIPVDNEGRLWINYRRPVSPEKDEGIFYSYSDVLAEAENGRDDYFKNNFSSRIVLIGFTDISQNDVFKTPFVTSNISSLFATYDIPDKKEVQVRSDYWMPGVEIHGHIISTILDNRYLIVAQWPINLSIVLLISLLTGFITYNARPYRALALCILLGVLYYAVVFACFTCFNTWIYFSIPILALVSTFSTVYLYKFITEEQERQRIRKLMGRYVSTNVMEALLSNPSQLALGGVRKKVTILFSDINNFTPTSEKLAPEELMRCLNSYFDEMNAIILKYNGTIKQFVGDEIMVMYGAPLEQGDQALRAVNTALEMVDKLNELKSRNLSGTPGFYEVKIGIHTGEVVVGNVGSHDRTEYAAVGDNVNLTSRIEGLNKKLGTTVLISEDTWREVKDIIVNAEFRSFEPQEVKGKTQRLTVYEVRRPGQGGQNE